MIKLFVLESEVLLFQSLDTDAPQSEILSKLFHPIADDELAA